MTTTTDRPAAREDLTCPECGAGMTLRESRYGPFYGCDRWPKCDATHGAHPDGSPLGVPADGETTAARIEAHEVFDQLWQDAHEMDCYNLPDDPGESQIAVDRIRSAARGRAYQWLADRMNLTVSECHIGAFDADQCGEVVDAAIDAMSRGGASFIRKWAKGEL